ncbi:hypothetical protein EXN66_Car018408 [Channa argus]|uniref:Uncharacterized protein n=1 Tax=Channa argus TaxID=215402 RepID=A0A6G1QJ47_CHAAH|nr:hypothetical protein EXN66_Car018408 [Channa argus]
MCGETQDNEAAKKKRKKKLLAITGWLRGSNEAAVGFPKKVTFKSCSLFRQYKNLC